MFGLLELPWWGYILVVLAITQATILSVTLYLHRCQAHRSLDLHPIVSHLLRFILWMTTGMVTKEWAAIHRKHHAKVETMDDPHSPQTRGLKKVLLEGTELYRAEAKIKETMERYGEGTPDDWIERKLYTPYSMYGVGIMLGIDLVLFGVIGVAIWAVQMAWIPFFGAGVVNGIGHYWGYRNYEPKDASRNIVPWGLFLGGEELHNNHHAFATSAKFSAKWWEIDLGWIIIRLLNLIGLAKPKRILSDPKIMPDKTNIDTETLKAVIMYKFQLLARYTRDVILPALNEEKKRASKASLDVLNRAKIVLIRDISLMKASQKMRLASVLDDFQSLKIVYQFRLALQEIWGRSTATQKELIDALQEWCQQAEATGIDALRKFAIQLKTYVPQNSAALMV